MTSFAHNKHRVLVLDGMWNKTLAAVRAFGKRGFYVAVGEWTRFSTALFSRYSSRRLIYPSPVLHPDEFIDWLISEIKENEYCLVLPSELATQLLILKNRETIETHTAVPFADYNTIFNIQNKAWLIRYAVLHGYPCPETIILDDTAGIRSVKGCRGFPVVIKPRMSSGSRGIVYVQNISDLETAYNEVHKRFPYPLIQEFIPHGGAYGVGVLFNYDSVPRACFVYKRLRENPVSGGPSTLRESVSYDEIKEIAISLLKSLDWIGPAMVEFRIDARTGEPKLMEINPRLWGALHLAIMSGVDFPYLIYKLAVNGDVKPVFKYKTGVRCRWLIPGDMMHFFSNPARFRLNPGFFTRTHGDDIISLDDPLPTIGRISSLLPMLFSKEMKRQFFP